MLGDNYVVGVELTFVNYHCFFLFFFHWFEQMCIFSFLGQYYYILGDNFVTWCNYHFKTTIFIPIGIFHF